MTLHHDLHVAGYFFNPRIQYKDNVHNDGVVMRGTMNVITRLARTMNERLNAMAEVERYKMKLGIYGGYNMTYAAQRLTPDRELSAQSPLPAPFPPLPPSGGLLPRRRRRSSEEARCRPPPPAPLHVVAAAASSFFLSFFVLFSLFLLCKIRRDYSLPINVDDDEDNDDPDPEFTAAARASRRSYAEEDDRQRGLGTSESHLSRDDSRRSLPRSTSVRRAAGALGCGGRLSDVHNPTQGPIDTYLYRSWPVKQPSIKQALKGVKATAKATKGAIKGYFFNPRFQYKDNVHDDGKVMRGTMNVITRLARTMNEILDAMAEVQRYKMKLGIYGGYDMRCTA
ncbi:hypothetical protein Taro_009984 [Colocasia esculenta]|uniref:Uncharacterized protein n=1 Tax=Colocasia esculenta TaxID=4460 RepID=A0A843TXQ7_COLES|nr:hypothetical protein [Colocasia esculenta]